MKFLIAILCLSALRVTEMSLTGSIQHSHVVQTGSPQQGSFLNKGASNNHRWVPAAMAAVRLPRFCGTYCASNPREPATPLHRGKWRIWDSLIGYFFCPFGGREDFRSQSLGGASQFPRPIPFQVRYVEPIHSEENKPELLSPTVTASCFKGMK